MRKLDFELVDCQVTTAHLMSLGAREIPRKDFLDLLADAVVKDGLPGSWASISLPE